MGRIRREDCAFNLWYMMLIYVQRVKTYDFYNKNFETSLLVSIRIWKKCVEKFKFFSENSKGNFSVKFFFHFLDVSGENTHCGEKYWEKNNFFILTSDKIDVWHLKSMVQSFLSTLLINFKIRFTCSIWKRFNNVPN